MLSSIFFFLITISIVVFFHEMGHYWAARICGVRVERFSVGFGKVIWRRLDKNNTEWVISALPLGGYVKPLQDPIPGTNGQDALNNKNVYQRFFIYAAGPLFSLLLGVIIYSGINFMGKQELAPILDAPRVGTSAYVAGIQKQDKVIAIDQKPIRSWQQLSLDLIEPAVLGKTVEVEVERVDGSQKSISLSFEPQSGQLDKVDLLGNAGLQINQPVPIIQEVQADGVGNQVGLKAGDIIVAVDDRKNVSLPNFIRYIKESPGRNVVLQLQRQGQMLYINMTPAAVTDETGNKQGRIGVLFSANLPTVKINYGFFGSIYHATINTYDMAAFSFKMLWHMVTGQISIKNLSGPVAIADYAGQSATMGIDSFINFIALISISIGVLNLVPIPGLDGGHMLFCVIEVIKGKAVSAKSQEKSLLIGYGLLFMLMIFAVFNDVGRLLH